MAIRENEDGAKALGVNISRYKTIALLISAALNALAGGFYMVYTTFIDPPLVFGGPFNFELLIAPIIGGRGTVLGPILGAILNKPMVELVRGYFSVSRAGTTLMIYGLFLMVFILFLPRGVIGLLEPPYRKFRQRMLSSLSASIDLASLGTAGVIIYGIDQWDACGVSVSGAGDINGDGFEDILVGAPEADGRNNGSNGAGDSYVIYGGATLAGDHQARSVGNLRRSGGPHFLR